MKKIIGICNCEAVSFELIGKVPSFYRCYCSLCQKATGTASNTATIIHIENFRWLSGESIISKWQKKSGFRSDFCSVCGSPVPNESLNSEYMWVPAGLIANLSTKVVADLCFNTKASWSLHQSAEKRFESLPNDLQKFIHKLA